MSDPTVRVAVLTVSDRGSAGEIEDRSGDAVASWVEARGFELAARTVVPDESDLITRELVRWADDDAADVILTTGGTGLAPRDRTPEATAAAIERPVPGIAEALRARVRDRFPRADLSRGIAGVRAGALIVNLPGSVGGVEDGLEVLGELLEHAVAILKDRAVDH